MSTMYDGASLASATGTRLDSGCKHIQQCRVSQDHMEKLVSDRLNLTNNKFKYAVHKDELVLGIGKCWGDDKRVRNEAYPRVLSNLGDQCSEEDAMVPKMIKYMYHNATSIRERDRFLKEVFKKGDISYWDTVNGYFKAEGGKIPFEKYMVNIHDFVPVGYANTLGYAHAHSGDTMTSVMIGGLRTVMNGDFEVFCGDLIQWYWPFERDCFEKSTAKRKAITSSVPGTLLNQDPANLGDAFDEDRSSKLRKQYHDREFGQREGAKNAKTVPLIKPYKRDEENPRIYDWYRVFAVALCSARPNEAVDIRISRQAI